MNLFLASSINNVAADITQRARSITKNKKLIFIPTAAEPDTGSKTWLSDDRQALVEVGYEVSDYSITNQTPDQIETALKDAGTICVGGGNTYYLLDQTRKSGFDKIITKLVKSGVIYFGSSAGSLLAGPSIETSLDKSTISPDLKDYSGLGLTTASVRPHWGSDAFAESYKKEMNRLYSLKQQMILLNDLQYLHVKDDWYQIVTVA